jgi:hypothetical protein
VDFDETFAPVMRLQSLRILLAIANQRRMHVHQMDVKTAFLHGGLQETIYMKQPEGFVKKGEENLVCKLQKSLYGLKQAPRCWNKVLDDFCTKRLGFYKCQKDHATYSRGTGRRQVYIGVYVDDLLIMSEDLEEIRKVKRELSKRFDMQDFGDASTILGMKLTYDRDAGVLSLSQEKYIQEILKRYNMDNCTGVVTPMSTGTKYTKATCPKDESEKIQMAKIPYRSAIGSLMYLMMCTRPDIATAVGVFSRFLENPGRDHWEGVKRVFRYLKATSDLKLTFRRTKKFVLKAYVDSDFAGCLDTSRSTTGWIFLLGGTAVSWSSKRQKSVTLSTCEAEYMAAGSATKESIWIRDYLSELGVEQEGPVNLMSDSQSAIQLVRNPVLHQSTKHIRTNAHFIREVVHSGEINLKYVQTKSQVADFLTKALTREKTEFCRLASGLE